MKILCTLKGLPVCLALFAFGLAAFPEPLTRQLVRDNSSSVVSEFKVEGKYKFPEAKARERAGIEAGMRLGDIDPDAVVQRFLMLGLFSEIGLDVELGEGDAVVTLTLQEKATLLPLPMVSISNGKQTYGGMLIDADFLGSGRSLMLGGFYSSDKSGMGLVGTGVQPRPGAMGYQLMLLGKDGTQKTEWLDGDDYRSWSSIGFSSSLTASIPLSANLSLQASGSASYSRKLVDAEAYGAPDDAFWLSPGIGASWSGQRIEDFFSSGLKVELAFAPGFDTMGGGSYASVTGSAGYGLPLFGDGALQLSSRGEASTRPDSALATVSGSRLLAGKTVQAADYGFAAVSFDYAALRFSAAILTLGAFYEAGAVREGLEGNKRTDGFRGPGIGLRVYLKRIAIPALGFDLDYEEVARNLNFGIAFGFAR